MGTRITGTEKYRAWAARMDAAEAAEGLKAPMISTGCSNDPNSMLVDALGMMQDVPEASHPQGAGGHPCHNCRTDGCRCMACRAHTLVKQHAIEDGRFGVANNANLDVVIVKHPKPETVNGMEVDHYIVFGRSYQGRAKGTCFVCNAAKRRGVKAAAHDCWKQKTWDVWSVDTFYKAHGIDDAEDVAKQLVASWEATTEMEEQGWDSGAGARQNSRELAFSNDFLLGSLLKQQNAWDSMSH